MLISACLLAMAQLDAGQPSKSQIVVATITSKIFNNTRSLRVYLPAGYNEDQAKRYPVLYLNDGFAVFAPRSWNAPHTLDALIAGGRIPPIIVVGIDNAASISGSTNPARDRAREYLPYRDPTEPEVTEPLGLGYPAFVVDEVMPLINARFRTQTMPATTGIGGSSYGAIAALVTAQQKPGVFGLLMLESAPLFLFDGKLVSATQSLNVWPDAIYIGLGTAETDDVRISKLGQSMFDELVRVTSQRAPRTRLLPNLVEGGTHTSTAWGARFATALEFLFGTEIR